MNDPRTHRERHGAGTSRWRRGITPARRSASAAATSIAVFVLLATACGPRPPAHREVSAVAGEVVLSRSEVGDGGVHFFTYSGGDREVHFLVRSDRDGTLRAHLDACFSCYRYRLGFVVEGDDLVCIACRYRYAVPDPEWDFIGACAPIAIPATLDGERFVIAEDVLRDAKRYF